MRKWTFFIGSMLVVLSGYLLVDLYYVWLDKAEAEDVRFLPSSGDAPVPAVSQDYRSAPGESIEEEPVSTPIELEDDSLEEVIRELAEPEIVETSGNSWVKIKFNVSDAGRISDVLVVESCRRERVQDHCADDDVHDRYAIRQVHGNRYEQPGTMEEIVFIPPRYSLGDH